ncbi:response regulator transcription factor [Cytobacillus sp. IB215316]|uniref:response regulator transcription factor n=1 Tax=Cytobacillus sp. IB215316 TaxID=3097354 RepID=UPI002A15F789|nr:response regulator transcription factor [Cytobacillus sp. IB215316]MDX8362474.1 response regulator transcription factor [Cytobacillus sp. IB215316]
MKKQILVVDDEINMRNLIKIHLSKDYEVYEADNGLEGLSVVKRKYQMLDLLILDIMMPQLDGWEVCKEIRQNLNISIPVLMLTARDEVADRVKGLEIGADDYLSKPFAPEELQARVNALIRRSSASRHENNYDGFLIFGDGILTIDSTSREVRINDVLIDLTPKEFELIHLLALHPNKVYTRDILLDTVWGYNEPTELRTVDTHIKNIRVKMKKLQISFNPIKTVWGVGYRLNNPDESV